VYDSWADPAPAGAPKGQGMRKLIASVESVAYHRNGICGEPFYVVLFTDAEGYRPMLATVFDGPPFGDGPVPVNPRVAVVSLLSVIRGQADDCYRGDNFAAELYAAIVAHQARERAGWAGRPRRCYVYPCERPPVAVDAEGLGFCAHHAGSDCTPLTEDGT
jgi:hypothetical protein